MAEADDTRPVGRGLGRRVADIVAMPAAAPTPSPLVRGPAVIPYEAVPVPMLICDSGGHVLAVNDRWEKASGRGPRSSLGAGWAEAVTSSGFVALKEAIAVVASGGGQATVDCPWAAHPDRSARWRLAAYNRHGQNLVGMVVTEADPLEQETDVALRAVLARLPEVLEGMGRVLATVRRMLDEDRI